MEKPNSIATRRVAVQYVIGAVDGPDADDEPDFIPARGVVEFTASVLYTPYPVVSGPNPMTVLNAKIVGILDDEGYLCTPHPSNSTLPGKRGVRLLCTDNVDGSVANWTWTAAPKFVDANGTRIADVIPPFSFYLPADPDPNAPDLDLTTVVKVPASQGVGNAQAEALAALASAAAASSADSAETAVAAATDAKTVALDVKRRADSGEFKGAEGKAGPAGPNTVPTQEAVAGYVATPGNPVSAAIAATVASVVAPKADTATVRATLSPAAAQPGARMPVTMLSGTVNFVGGNAGADATEPVIGATNYYVNSGGAQAYNQSVDWVSLPPQNMIGKGLMLMMKATDMQNLQFLTIYASSAANFSSYFRFRVQVPSKGKSPLTEGRWGSLFIPWSNFYIMSQTGAPDASAITAIRVNPVDFGGGKSSRVDLGSKIGVYTEPAATGHVMWSFDDSWPAAHDLAPKLAEYGWRATMHPIVERLGQTGFITTSDLLKFQNLYGWEVGAHCMTNAQHATMIGQTREQIDAMMVSLRGWQQANGFRSPAFAYPIGPYDESVNAAVAPHFSYARTNDECHSPSRLANPLGASAVALSATANNLASLKAMGDQAVANKSTIHIIVHKLLTTGTPSTNEWLLSDALALVDYYASIGLKNMTPTQLLAQT